VQGPNNLQFYDSHWVRFLYQWVYQMKASPLRVHSPEAADFIFVPVCLGAFCGRPTNPLYFSSHVYRWKHSTSQDRKSYFFANAHKMLPWLGKKPHVMVYNSAMGPGLVGHAGNFTFIGLESRLDMDRAHFITVPYPSHEHHGIYEPPQDLGKCMTWCGDCGSTFWVTSGSLKATTACAMNECTMLVALQCSMAQPGRMLAQVVCAQPV
jgi:hypothetical protein